MQVRLITVGKPAAAWSRQACDEYLRRLTSSWRAEWRVLKDGTPEAVTTRMLEASEGCLRVALDETGKAWRSVELARWFEQRQLDGSKRVAFLIGGADGHSDQLLSKMDLCWSLSALTMQHDIALVVLLEQLYRVGTILRGEPYHREG